MTRLHNRFISSEEIGSAVDWNFAAVDQSAVRFAAKLKAQAEAEERERESVARQGGYAEGYAEGHAQGLLEGQRRTQEYIRTQGEENGRIFAQLFADAERQIADSEQVMAQGMLELACSLARQVLRHEMATNPNALLPVIREALALLSADCKSVLVRMHPLDMDVLEEVLRQEFGSLALSVVADPTLTRGGCLVESAGTVVDGSVEKRWQRAVAKLGLELSWEAGDADR